MQRAPGTCNRPGCPNVPVYRGRCPEHVQWNSLSPRQRGRALMDDRDRLMRSRGRICQRCYGPPPLELHHLDGDPANDHDSNRILLCVDCHRIETAEQRVTGGEQLTLTDEGTD
jgi:hypothetical protein